MKKIGLLVIILLVSSIMVYAQEDDENIIKAGIITPDDGFLYNIDVIIDNIKLSFAKDKVLARLKIADERLAEMNLMAIEKKPKALGLAREEYNQHIIIIKARIENSDTPLANEEFVIERISKHIVILESVLEKVPEQGKEGIRNAIENSRKVVNRKQVEV